MGARGSSQSYILVRAAHTSQVKRGNIKIATKSKDQRVRYEMKRKDSRSWTSFPRILSKTSNSSTYLKALEPDNRKSTASRAKVRSSMVLVLTMASQLFNCFCSYTKQPFKSREGRVIEMSWNVFLVAELFRTHERYENDDNTSVKIYYDPGPTSTCNLVARV